MKCIIGLAFVLTCFTCCVYSRGMREDFTWSRISYVLPSSGRSRPYRHASAQGPPRHGQGSTHNNHGQFMYPQDSSNTNSNQFGQGSTQFGQGSTQFGQGNAQFGQSQSNSQIGQSQSNSQTGQSNTQTQNGNYIYQNNIPMGANRWKNKLFITVPRRRDGVPSTLNFIWTNTSQNHNVPLIPYPNYDINQLPVRQNANSTHIDEVHLVSIYRTAVDICDRLWVVDTGLIETPGNNSQVQQPSIVIFDLKTNRLIRKYNLKASDLRPGTNLASLVIDVTATNCNDAYAYLPDLGGFGLVVYSLREDDSWRITHNYFYLESQAGEFNVGGIDFQWNDGIFSVALSAFNIDGFRTLYFHSLAGTHIYSVSTEILRNQQLATRSYHANDFKILVNRGPNTQSSSSDLHIPSGVLFLGLVNQNAVGCWNTHKGARPEHFDIVHKDDRKMIYPCDVKIAGDELIVLSNTMPVFLYGTLNYDQVNFRVWVANVHDAIQGTACDDSNARPPHNRKPPAYYN